MVLEPEPETHRLIRSGEHERTCHYAGNRLALSVWNAVDGAAGKCAAQQAPEGEDRATAGMDATHTGGVLRGEVESCLCRVDRLVLRPVIAPEVAYAGKLSAYAEGD